MKRLGIVLFFDKDGIVDDYFVYYVKKLRPFYTELCIVVNEFLNPTGVQILTQLSDKLIIRKNVGMDVMAYKQAIESYGFDNIKQYDEMLLTNYTSFGPFYPLSEMFDAMDAKHDIDFWSVFKWPIDKKDVIGIDETPLTYDHLPSFFISYRKSLLQSEHFKEYWMTLPKIVTYMDSCIYHERRQTPYFENLGFKSGSYIDITKYKNKVSYFPYICATNLIKNDRCPFIKRRQFFIVNKKFPCGYDNILSVIKFLKKKKLYDVSMIKNNIIRTQDVESLPRHKRFSYYWRLFLKIVCFQKHDTKHKNVITKKDFINAFK